MIIYNEKPCANAVKYVDANGKQSHEHKEIILRVWSDKKMINFRFGTDFINIAHICRNEMAILIASISGTAVRTFHLIYQKLKLKLVGATNTRAPHFIVFQMTVAYSWRTPHTMDGWMCVCLCDAKVVGRWTSGPDLQHHVAPLLFAPLWRANKNVSCANNREQTILPRAFAVIAWRANAFRWKTRKNERIKKHKIMQIFTVK